MGLFRKKRNLVAGTLRIENSDPDGPYLFVELSVDPRELSKHKHVTFKVSTESYISQE